MNNTENRRTDTTGNASEEVEKLQLLIELRRENGSLTAREAGVLREVNRLEGVSPSAGRMRGNMGAAATGWSWGGATSGAVFRGDGNAAAGDAGLDMERNRLLARIEAVLLQNQNPKKELV